MGRKNNRTRSHGQELSPGLFLPPIQDEVDVLRAPQATRRQRQKSEYTRYGSSEQRRRYLTTGIGRMVTPRSLEQLLLGLEHQVESMPRTGIAFATGTILAPHTKYGLQGTRQRLSPEGAVRSVLLAAQANMPTQCETTKSPLTIPATALGIRKWGNQMLLYATTGDIPKDEGDSELGKLLAEKICYVTALRLPNLEAPKPRSWDTTEHTIPLAKVATSQATEVEAHIHSTSVHGLPLQLEPVGTIKTELPG